MLPDHAGAAAPKLGATGALGTSDKKIGSDKWATFISNFLRKFIMFLNKLR